MIDETGMGSGADGGTLAESGVGRGAEAGSDAHEAEQAEPLPNLVVRLLQVFFSPAALFDRLKQRPVWIGAILALIVLSLVANLLLPEEILRQAVQAQLGPDATAQQVEAAARVGAIVGRVGAVLFPPLVVAIVAGVLILIYNTLTGGEATFRQLYSATAHAFVITTLGGFLTLGLIVARGDVQVALALHVLAPGLETTRYLYRFLHGINVFGLWTAVVLGIAVSRIYPRRSAGSAAMLLIALYVLFKAAMATFGAAG